MTHRHPNVALHLYVFPSNTWNSWKWLRMCFFFYIWDENRIFKVIFMLIWVIDGWCISCEITLGWLSLNITDSMVTKPLPGSVLTCGAMWRHQASVGYMLAISSLTEQKNILKQLFRQIGSNVNFIKQITPWNLSLTTNWCIWSVLIDLDQNDDIYVHDIMKCLCDIAELRPGLNT